jgi:hypothetical protein
MASSPTTTPAPFSWQAQLAALDADSASGNGASDLGVTEILLPLLLSASPAERAMLFQTLLQRSTPRAITEVAFREYDRTGHETYLLQAVALLEAFGTTAWPVLRSLATSPRPESELFVGLIARCRDVSTADRLLALADLTGHPSEIVRAGLFERLSGFSPQEVHSLLRKLADDPDPEIREEARERLAALGL